MSNAIVSVGVTVYNLEKYIEKCILSILNQTFTDFELIIIDDGSSDNSRSICEKLSTIDARISYVFQENKGVSAARNKALDLFKGEYYLLVDGDDTLHPDMIKKLYYLCREYNAEIATCKLLSVKSDSEIKFEYYAESTIQLLNNKTALTMLLKNNFTGFGLCNKLFKKELFEEVKFPLNRKFEDAAIQYKLLYKAKRIIMTDEKLYYYLIHAASTTRADLQNYSSGRLDIIMNFEESYQFMKDNHLPEEIVELNLANYYRSLRGLTIDILNADMKDQKKALKIVNKQIKKWKQKMINNSQVTTKEKTLLWIWAKMPNITLNVYKIRNKLIL
ncbi:glycosyltransferase family 2 protein [Alkalicoccus daliensis]|uniref:Glycosyltransferase involved in cell wall bisynthesis n=1 Tax=Alkalicoccus daliensis TaxID=745820 RepID=A0A1G9ZLR2_9BACI|nr:glycosyltransferase family 2 protein [Alkalicoccus daliensis]SDN22298.1 Glycosyltransferase involved in cell wall bisynthesis [Alkalicoccus daliensis]